MNFSYNKGEGNDRLDHTLNQKRGKNYEDVLETKRRTINIIGSGGRKASSVHLLLNSLLNKGVIEVRGFKRTAKNYARTFQPSLSKIESTYIILS